MSLCKRVVTLHVVNNVVCVASAVKEAAVDELQDSLRSKSTTLEWLLWN